MTKVEKQSVKMLTINEFKAEIDLLNANNLTFNVRSQGDGNIFLSVCNCNISVYMADTDGICGEIIISKPESNVRIVIDTDAIQDIIQESNNRYCLDMDSSMCMSDIDIKIVE